MLKEPFVQVLGNCLNSCIDEAELAESVPDSRSSRQGAPATTPAAAALTMVSH